jgi:hypothetical protein
VFSPHANNRSPLRSSIPSFATTNERMRRESSRRSSRGRSEILARYQTITRPARKQLPKQKTNLT